MFNSIIVKDALKSSWAIENNLASTSDNSSNGQDCLFSQLIYDIFGGEILKTHEKKGWHFYNRIDGERIDLTRSETINSFSNNSFDDIPSSPDETYNYFEQVDYSTFLLRFVRAYEESVGLDNDRTNIAS